MKDENYRPKVIEFDVAHDGSNVPMSLGEYKNDEEAAKFLATNFTAVNQPLTVSRHMDNFEKSEIRKQDITGIKIE